MQQLSGAGDGDEAALSIASGDRLVTGARVELGRHFDASFQTICELFTTKMLSLGMGIVCICLSGVPLPMRWWNFGGKGLIYRPASIRILR